MTAAFLAERLEVSERTIYRDVQDLIASGTPIAGEAGVGYSLGAGYDLPPLMFDTEELEALVLGARLVASYADSGLARASRSVLAKVESMLPERLRPALERSPLYAPNLALGERVSRNLIPIRNAVVRAHKLRLDYVREDGERSQRVVRPLGAFFWGRSWTLTAYCELREDFRSFRIDRIRQLELLPDTFEAEPGKNLSDFLLRVGPRAAESLGL